MTSPRSYTGLKSHWYLIPQPGRLALSLHSEPCCYSRQSGHAVMSSVILGSHGYSPYGARSLFVCWEILTVNALSPVVTDKGGTQQQVTGRWKGYRERQTLGPDSKGQAWGVPISRTRNNTEYRSYPLATISASQSDHRRSIVLIMLVL